MKFFNSVLALTFLALNPAAFARDHNGQFSVGAGAGPVLEAPWARDNFKDAVSPGPRATLFARSHYESSEAGWELSLDHLDFGSSSLTSTSVIVSYFYRWNVNSKLHPIFSFGIGHAWNRNYFSQGDYDTAIFKVRAGVEYELSPDWDVALHLDHFSVFKDLPADPNMHGLAPTISIIRYFGKVAPPEPTTPAAVPAGASATGASTSDSDGDKVVDADDRCPNTPAGQKVNGLGCARSQRFEITPAIRFPFQKADLPADTDAALTDVVALLKRYPDLQAEVQGHTDTQGTEAQNDKLSRARADVVRKRLMVKFGIKGNRLRAKGYGSSQPVAANRTQAEHARNRRVTLRFSQ